MQFSSKMSKEMIKLMVEEEVQKCLREKVRDIVAKKLLSQAEKVEQLVTESLNSLLSAETETYDAVYDHITGAYVCDSQINKCNTTSERPFHTIDCDIKNRMNFTKGARKLIPNKCSGECVIEENHYFNAPVESKFTAVMGVEKNMEFRVHKYPSKTDPSIIVSEIRRGKLMGINVIINNTCDCAVFKAACLPKTEIKEYKIPTCDHMEFVKKLNIPVAAE